MDLRSILDGIDSTLWRTGRTRTAHRRCDRVSLRQKAASGQFPAWAANQRLEKWYATSFITWDWSGTISFVPDGEPRQAIHDSSASAVGVADVQEPVRGERGVDRQSHEAALTDDGDIERPERLGTRWPSWTTRIRPGRSVTTRSPPALKARAQGASRPVAITSTVGGRDRHGSGSKRLSFAVARAWAEGAPEAHGGAEDQGASTLTPTSVGTAMKNATPNGPEARPAWPS